MVAKRKKTVTVNRALLVVRTAHLAVVLTWEVLIRQIVVSAVVCWKNMTLKNLQKIPRPLFLAQRPAKRWKSKKLSLPH